MKTYFAATRLSGQCGRALLLLGLAAASTGVLAEPAHQGMTPLPVGACPLNSGGPSLLGSEWRLLSVYGNPVPAELEINLKVEENALSGFSGCNDYATSFKRVGHTGFMMTGIEKGKAACRVLTPAPGGPSINVGDWEGGFIRTLQRAGSVQQEGNTLHFYNRSGEPSVVLAKKYGSL
jgi:heat shock protein HslJ